MVQIDVPKKKKKKLPHGDPDKQRVFPERLGLERLGQVLDRLVDERQHAAEDLALRIAGECPNVRLDKPPRRFERRVRVICDQSVEAGQPDGEKRARAREQDGPSVNARCSAASVMVMGRVW